LSTARPAGNSPLTQAVRKKIRARQFSSRTNNPTDRQTDRQTNAPGKQGSCAP